MIDGHSRIRVHAVEDSAVHARAQLLAGEPAFTDRMTSEEEAIETG
jgi:hypothetical protein